jgi:hypothetical protein
LVPCITFVIPISLFFINFIFAFWGMEPLFVCFVFWGEGLRLIYLMRVLIGSRDLSFDVIELDILEVVWGFGVFVTEDFRFFIS